jgi:predicted Zn-ribbon and HTH transcriptional regulator
MSKYDEPTTDDVIYPFVCAHLENGYEIEKTITDSDKLSRCPQCKSPYMYTLLKKGVKSNKCPFCGYWKEV